jgi:hypothetical protein
MDYWNIMYNVLKMPFRVFLDFKEGSLRQFSKFMKFWYLNLLSYASKGEMNVIGLGWLLGSIPMRIWMHIEYIG